MRPRRGAELPQLELDCMIALWRGGEASAAAIREALAAGGRPLAYTTVLTVLQRLQRKQMVAARKRGRAFWFAPCVSRDVLRAPAVARLVNNYFDSGEDLRRYLSDSAAVASAPLAANGAVVPPPRPANGAAAPNPGSAREGGTHDAAPAAAFDASLL